MTSIQLDDGTAKALAAIATARQMTVDQYLRSLVASIGNTNGILAQHIGNTTPKADLSERAQALTPEWVGVVVFQNEPDALGASGEPGEPIASHEPGEPHEPPTVADAPQALPPPLQLLRVVRPAGKVPRKADLRGELALELLKRRL